MGLSKKQRLDKQKRHRVKQAERARARKAAEKAARAARLPRNISQTNIAPKGPSLLQKTSTAVARATRGITSAMAATFWTALMPLALAGWVCEEIIGLIAIVEPIGLFVFGAMYYMCVEFWQKSGSNEEKWVVRMEKLEREVSLLREQVSQMKAGGVMPAVPAAKPVTLRAAPPAPAPAPPPPPPMMRKRTILPKPFALKKVAPKKEVAKAAGPMSLATLLNAKSGLKSGNNRVLAPSKAKKTGPGMAICLADISNVQLKRITRKANKPLPATKSTTPLLRHLRKTQIQRSPGGTPMRSNVTESSDSRTNLLSSALRNKFKTVRLPSPKSCSPNPSGDCKADENYLSPYAPRIR